MSLVDNNPLLSVQLSRPYLSQNSIDLLLAMNREVSTLTETKEAQMKLAACSWMHVLGKRLQFPVRTIGTAMMIYHRFLLFHSTAAFGANDVSSACLFVASKMEDTAKKARDILIMAHAIRNPHGPELNPESATLEEQRKRVLGLERMILETQSFDFRFRHPQPTIVKFARRLNLNRSLAVQAWQISIDSYRIWLPLKFPPHVIALACLTLACKFFDSSKIVEPSEFFVDRHHLYIALEDLLDLYLHSRACTTADGVCSEGKLMEIKFDLIKDQSNAALQIRSGQNGLQKTENLSSIGDRGTCRYLLDPERLESDQLVTTV